MSELFFKKKKEKLLLCSNYPVDRGMKTFFFFSTVKLAKLLRKDIYLL